NQICGRGHFAMRMEVIVEEPEDYIAWLSQQKSFSSQNPEILANLKKKAQDQKTIGVTAPVGPAATAAVQSATPASL
ncbi:cytochrome c oxidase subunit II, partial [Hymenobacter defluvii]|nr:cytochrome c oxidase subunit II [Hymenobacter defluvii]